MYSKFGSLWRKWDLHIHTDASDGKGTCEEILKEAAAKKISCIAISYRVWKCFSSYDWFVSGRI